MDLNKLPVQLQNTVSIIDFTKNIELLDNTSIKWKKETSSNQVVIGTENKFYKVYAFTEVNKFNSVIRHKLADVYKSYNISWDIVTLQCKGDYLDIEQRQVLPVCEQFNDDILINYSETLRRLEKELNFDYILSKIRKTYPQVAKIKLVRSCINKKDDYAWYNDKVVLLDDADWYIALVGEFGEKISLPTPCIPLNIFDEEYIFTSNIFNNDKKFNIDDSQKLVDKFFIYRDIGSKNKILTLKSKYEQELEKNIDLFIREDAKIMETNLNDNTYINNAGKISFQWEVWSYCGSNCKFCYLGTENRVHVKERQLTSLNDLDKAIDNLDFNKYNNISLIGGEFFQGQLNDPEIHDKFFDVIKKIFKLYQNKKIGSIWITATLTLGDQKHLYELLDLAESMKIMPNINYGASGLWICTSWDAEGRFHKPAMKENWEYHMKNMKKLYPWVKLNTTIILTEPLLDLYLNGEFSPKKFMQEFDTALFYKQCGIPNTNFADDGKSFDECWLTTKQDLNKKFGFTFFPHRDKFLKFLSKYYAEDFDTFERLFNIKFRADELHRNFNSEDHDTTIVRAKDGITPEENVQQLPCGHIYNYAPYVDSNKCCICDREIIKEGM